MMPHRFQYDADSVAAAVVVVEIRRRTPQILRLLTSKYTGTQFDSTTNQCGLLTEVRTSADLLLACGPILEIIRKINVSTS
ncbi:unnamed protein product [Acanthoscelides obtectus]|uniref:Uncharacterized protein n=1 Tax=Acanthoscelides obtectus TaxID=200917 RepID=A0A9P0L3T2_ACAOB|nr:unnamed protein product [Acanthoscelides obtectus]CAK1661723.1 hypothetical protein AOBTE_LOCUS22753 [Acanthoscelides obtectus]